MRHRRPETVVFRGGGEMSSAAARLVFLSGFPVTILERLAPLAVRRKVAFAQAVFTGEVMVEGVRGVLARAQALPSGPQDFIPVVADPDGACIPALRPIVLVDGRMAKANLGTRPEDALLVVALGPGFRAGRDVHAVVETQRGPDLGRVYWEGSAQSDTATPSPVMGWTRERVVWSPRSGVFRTAHAIGAMVEAGETVGEVDGVPVAAAIAGLLRGLLADGVTVTPGTKLGDVDPRGKAVDPARLSEKGRAVAAGVLEAVLAGLDRDRGIFSRSEGQT